MQQWQQAKMYKPMRWQTSVAFSQETWRRLATSTKRARTSLVTSLACKTIVELKSCNLEILIITTATKKTDEINPTDDCRPLSKSEKMKNLLQNLQPEIKNKKQPEANLIINYRTKNILAAHQSQTAPPKITSHSHMNMDQ